MKRFFYRVRMRASHILERLTNSVRPPEPPGLNLSGDRDIEWSWVLSNLHTGPGKVLELGPGPFPMLALTAAQRGYDVLALDRQLYNWPFNLKGLSLKQGDILTENLSPEYFNMIINCSVIEHVGLSGRYGVESFVSEGDLETMTKLSKTLKRGGTMILTLPVGKDALFAPFHRIYGAERLPKLLEGWDIQKEIYWSKTSDNIWVSVSREEALSRIGNERYYGLGCFVLTN